MFIHDTLIHRLKRGCETMGYPDAPAPALPDRHGGALRVDAQKCQPACRACIAACPTQAIARTPAAPVALDLGRCVFCSACVAACPTQAIVHTGDHRMAVRRRSDLVLGASGQEEIRLAAALDEKIRSLLGRSLRLRQVSAGGCGACEADTNVLGTIGWDLARFGIQFVASPRHADGILVTGPVTRNMHLALLKTWNAVPGPKILIAVGACAISGGPFAGNPAIDLAPEAPSDAAHNGVESILPVDLFIPGCPPHPLTILDGLLRILDRLKPPSNPAH